jgi:phage recombination protein Bet
MSETTTAKAGQTIPGGEPRAAAPLATTTSGSLAVRGDSFTDDQTAVLRAMGLEHASEGDLKLFHYYAQRTGLDPFTRQVYMVGRDTEITVREVNTETGNERDVKRRVTKFTIQVGIDGWRVLGNRAAHRDGVRVGHKAPLYAGKDGVWSSIWLGGADVPPLACQYTLTADGVEVTAVCYYSEYVQFSGRGEVTSMWKKMPLNQLAKCTEALAWRKAFPADFAGLVLEDAVQADVIDGTVEPDGEPTPTKAEPKRARGGDRVRQRAKAAQQETPEQADRARCLGAIIERLNEGKVTTDDDKRIVIAELAGLKALPNHPDDIPDRTLVEVLVKLDRMAEAAKGVGEVEGARTLEHQLDDVFRTWETRQADADEQSDEAQA